MTQGSGTTFAVLGPVEVRGPDGVVAVGRPGHRALLALMLLRANRVLGLEEIVRQSLPDGRRILRTRDHGYLLDVEPGALDLFRFEHGLAHASVEQDKAAAAVAFRSALALWRGTPFTGIDAAFVDRGQVEEILGMVSDPMGALTDHAEGEIEELFEPLREAVSAPGVDVELEDAPENLFQFGEDLTEGADTDTLTEAPTTRFDPGPDPTRDGR